MGSTLALIAFCVGICCVWAYRSGKECIEAGDNQEPTYNTAPSLRDQVEKYLELSGMKARMTSDEVKSFVFNVQQIVIKEKTISYHEGCDITAKALGFVCPPPIEKCPNDTDGDGNCQYCLDNPKGCFYRK